MSIPKLQLVPQPKPQAEVVRHAHDTLDFTRAIIVNREQLAEKLGDARHVSNILHNVENLDDLSWEEMTDLCRAAHRAARALAAMLETKEVEAQ
jgi:hypothetical protein